MCAICAGTMLAGPVGGRHERVDQQAAERPLVDESQFAARRRRTRSARAGAARPAPTVPRRATARSSRGARPGTRRASRRSGKPQVLAAPATPPRCGARAAAPRSPPPPGRWRRTARGWRTSTASTTRPTTQRSRPARTVSTSGSSGTRQALGTRACRASDRASSARQAVSAASLLGLLLAASGARVEQLAADGRPRGERLRVVRADGGDHVLGHAEPALGGELLQAGLPVQAGAVVGHVGEHLVEQIVDDPARRRRGRARRRSAPSSASTRVGQDAGLVPAAGALLAAAEQQVRRRARASPMPRATSASARMLTTEARSLASLPSGRSGWAR